VWVISVRQAIEMLPICLSSQQREVWIVFKAKYAKRVKLNTLKRIRKWLSQWAAILFFSHLKQCNQTEASRKNSLFPSISVQSCITMVDGSTWNKTNGSNVKNVYSPSNHLWVPYSASDKMKTRVLSKF
jgi:hypothetical protein